ncbi:MAG: type II toxin-antitoxin system VapC family toxin [Longimicrobiales bacterium]
MRLLLDTHVWLWGLLEPERLGRRASRAFSESGTESWLSPISVWECALLIERDRLAVEGLADEWIRRALLAAPLHEAPLNHEVALWSRRISLGHPDPADRFLAATAAVYDLTLVTADRRLLAGRGYRVLNAR